MKWKNLKNKLCSVCNNILNQKDMYFVCECGFKIRLEKYKNILQGKKSNKYLQIVKRNQKIQEYNRKIKQHFENQNNENRLNLERMLRQGKITQEYYNNRVNCV